MPLPSEKSNQTRLRRWLQSRVPTRRLNCPKCEAKGNWNVLFVHPQRPDSFGMTQYVLVCEKHGQQGLFFDVDCYQDPTFEGIEEVIQWRSR